jgi:aminopeptidase N
MEETSGQDLDWFFAQWLRRGSSPRVAGTWTYNAASKQVIVELAQEQQGEVYRLPLQIGISLPGAAVKLTNVSLAGLTARFEIACEKEPQAVTLDPTIQTLMDTRFSRRQ